MKPLAVLLISCLGAASTWAQEQGPKPDPEYRLVYWFDWSRPVETFRHHAYDLRAGEYPAQAVQEWKQGLRQSHPNYAVLLRDVRLADLPGETDQQKLDEAVHRQFAEIVMIASVPGPTPGLGPPVPDVAESHRQTLRPAWSSPFSTGYTSIDEVYPTGRRPLGSAGFRTGPGWAPMPFPMPYTRPHP
jgi:hypothetical protein